MWKHCCRHLPKPALVTLGAKLLSVYDTKVQLQGYLLTGGRGLSEIVARLPGVLCYFLNRGRIRVSFREFLKYILTTAASLKIVAIIQAKA